MKSREKPRGSAQGVCCALVSSCGKAGKFMLKAGQLQGLAQTSQ